MLYVLCPAIAASSALAQSVKLNGPLPRPFGGDVVSYLLSPDGSRVVYRADQMVDQRWELFSVPVDRSRSPVRLNGGLPSGGTVGGFFIFETELRYAIGADDRVAYIADQQTLGLLELFSVPIDRSSAPIRLSTGQGVSRLWLREDGREVFYLGDGSLYRVPIDGSAPPTWIVQVGIDVWLSPDGTTAVFSMPFAFGEQELFSVATDGVSSPVSLAVSGPPIDFGYAGFDQVEFTADGQQAVYYVVRDEDGDGDADLYSVFLDGSQPAVKLNPQPLDLYFRNFDLGAGRVIYNGRSVGLDGTGNVQLGVPGGTVTSTIRVAADGLSVVFRERFAGSPEMTGVYRGSIDGSQYVLEGTDPAPNTIEFPGTLDLVDASTAVYVGYDVPWDGFGGLYSIPLDGGPSVLLNGPAVPGQSANRFALHPDGETLVYSGDRDQESAAELYAVPLDGSLVPRRLHAPLIGAGDVRSFRITPDGAYAVFHADAEHDETFELYGARIDGTAPNVRYNMPLQVGPVLGDVLSFRATPDGNRVVYRADQDEDGLFDLFTARTDGRGPRNRVTAPLTVTTVLPDFALTPSGSRTVFQDVGSTLRVLYSAPTAGGGSPAPLDSASLAFAAPFLFDPAGARVVYRAASQANVYSLRSAPVDGSAPAITLADPPGNLSVREVQLDPQGDTVVYRADGSAFAAVELFSVPIDGSAAPVQLNPPLVSGGAVNAFQISPDSARAVFRGDIEVDAEQELFVRPIDASAPALQLNAALVSGGDVVEFALTDDGQRAVYRADQTVDEVFELFGVPLDASAPPVRLNAAPVAGGDVTASFLLRGTGNALYLADQDTDEVFELYTVPDDGSTAPVKLSAALVAGGDVSAFALSPDQSRVVYLADQRVDGVVEPFSVPADGSSAPVALHVLPSFADASSIQIDPESASVAYHADANTDGVLELFSVPLDGSALPRRLNRDLAPGGDVQADFVTLTGGRVLYRADEDASNVFELFCYLNLGLERPVQRGRSLDGSRGIQR